MAKRTPWIRPLPVRSTVRLRRPVDIWHKPALSAAAALAVPDVTLLALGRLDLILYTSAGAMCALYAHGLPYAARARTLALVVLGMVASLGVALTAASLVTSPALLVLLASLVAAVHKMVCDATRTGPPGNLILTFISASAFFVPQRPGEIPFHLALALAGGAVAWLICMAPGLFRPHGPERIAVARALEAAAALWRERPEEAALAAGRTVRVLPARGATAGAVNAAWHTLFQVRRSDATRAGLERLLVHAESALASPAAGRTDSPAREAERCGELARTLRRGRALPRMDLTPGEERELSGVAAERRAVWRPRRPAPDRPGGGQGLGPVRPIFADQAAASGACDRKAEGLPSTGRTGVIPTTRRACVPGVAGPRRSAGQGLVAQLRPGSPLLPIGARVAVGCALAGWVSLAAGVGHPYWAVVTAASIYQANTTLSWQRAVQRALGNVLGLAVFVALLPLIRTGALTMVLLALACQVGAEALITRNYWLGSVCVTPMALLLTEFGNDLPARTLIADRAVDTVVGVAIGLACCVLVTNRRATDRIDLALARVTAAESAARRSLDPVRNPPIAAAEPYETGWARDRLTHSLVELREAVEVASGEWWQRALPAERVATAERDGHRTLALLVRHTAPAAPVP
ncbi:FUSC family protein [Streptomyces scopuliridis]|uniref:FUSC family protein n=1 Tax=Streptomyces scopuliridis TaxID=452529 RepID=UPI002DD910F5|nr:FUSC family protein [Streptomyces scopuliridis]WSB32258.1 FUSC family protein [Streptomyces scopuliridis]